MKIVYIVGTGHSGSTLLDLLISSHESVSSVGEAKRFNPETAPTTSCSCSVKRVWDCPYWLRVGESLQETSGIGLRQLNLVSADPAEFIEHNVAFYNAVQNVSGRNVIVDSSKNPSRLRSMLDAGCFDVFPVHLIRRPHGVIYSNVKKKRNWLRTAIGYSRNLASTREALRGHGYFVVRYERLATDPRGLLEDLMPRIGLGFEPGQLEWAMRERHNCGGNRMRRSKTSEIRLDETWRTGLSRLQQTVISLLTMRTRP